MYWTDLADMMMVSKHKLGKLLLSSVTNNSGVSSWVPSTKFHLPTPSQVLSFISQHLPPLLTSQPNRCRHHPSWQKSAAISLPLEDFSSPTRQHQPPPSSSHLTPQPAPSVSSPPAKQTREWRCVAELLRDSEVKLDLILSSRSSKNWVPW